MDSQDQIRKVWAGYTSKYYPMAAVVIQASWRGYNCRRRLRALKTGTLIKVARDSVRRETTASVVIQRYYRGGLARHEAKLKHGAIVTIQSYWRMYMVRRGWRRRLRQWRWEKEAAVLIQAYVRGHLARLLRKRLSRKGGVINDPLLLEDPSPNLPCNGGPGGGSNGHEAAAAEDSSVREKWQEEFEVPLGYPLLAAAAEEKGLRSLSLTEDLDVGESQPSSSSLLVASPPAPSSPSAPRLHPLEPPASLEPTLSQRQLRPLKSMPRLTPPSSSSFPSPTKQASFTSAIASSRTLSLQSSTRIKKTSISETIAAARDEAGLLPRGLQLSPVLSGPSSSRLKTLQNVRDSSLEK